MSTRDTAAIRRLADTIGARATAGVRDTLRQAADEIDRLESEVDWHANEKEIAQRERDEARAECERLYAVEDCLREQLSAEMTRAEEQHAKTWARVAEVVEERNQARAECERAWKAHDRACDREKALAMKLDRAVDQRNQAVAVLRWYAKAAKTPAPVGWGASMFDDDQGQRARECLAELDPK